MSLWDFSGKSARVSSALTRGAPGPGGPVMSPRRRAYAWPLLPIRGPVTLLLVSLLALLLLALKGFPGGPDGQIAMAAVMVIQTAAVFSAWAILAQELVKFALTADQLRLPGLTRALAATVAGVAALTLAVMVVAHAVLHDAPFSWMELTGLMIGMGSLCALFEWSLRWVPCLGLLIIFPAFLHIPWGLPRGLVTILSFLALLILAGRLAALGHAHRRGVRCAVLEEALQDGPWPEARAASAGVRAGWRGCPPVAAARSALGPLYGSRAMLKGAAGVLLAGVAPLAWIKPDLLSPVAGGALGLAAMCASLWFLRLATRLAALLEQPGAEMAELALLPGVGSSQQQERTMLREALLRPLAWIALMLGGILAAYAARIDPPSALLILVVVFSAAMVLLFATVTIGVLARQLRPTHPWVQAVATLLFFPLLFPSAYSLADRGRLSLWEGLAWGLVLGALCVCLISWARLVRRRARMRVP